MSERVEFRGNVAQWMVALLVENAYLFRTRGPASIAEVATNVPFIETFFRFPAR